MIPFTPLAILRTCLFIVFALGISTSLIACSSQTSADLLAYREAVHQQTVPLEQAHALLVAQAVALDNAYNVAATQPGNSTANADLQAAAKAVRRTPNEGTITTQTINEIETSYQKSKAHDSAQGASAPVVSP